jgi:hypothetical protein
MCQSSLPELDVLADAVAYRFHRTLTEALVDTRAEDSQVRDLDRLRLLSITLVLVICYVDEFHVVGVAIVGHGRLKVV